MGICMRCHQETSEVSVTTCEGYARVEYPDGKTLPPKAYDPKELRLPQWFRCPDCNVVPGGRHHCNCDQEQCPQCGGQLISCDCF